jgi:hypothetical protein
LVKIPTSAQQTSSKHKDHSLALGQQTTAKKNTNCLSKNPAGLLYDGDTQLGKKAVSALSIGHEVQTDLFGIFLFFLFDHFHSLHNAFRSA